MNYQERQEIISLAQGLNVGENSSPTTCPRCNGGNNADKSFTVSPIEGGILFLCYRAGCKFKGMVRTGRQTILEAPRENMKQREKSPNPYTRQLVCLSTRQRAFLYRKYSLTSSDVSDWRWSKEDERIAMAINDFRGYRIGWQLRHYPELALRGHVRSHKAISYWDSRRVALMHFEWHTEDVRAFTCVEDVVSAKRVAKYQNAIALLGTGLTDDSVAHLLQIGVRDVRIALDEDAWAAANKMKRRYSLFFENFNVITWSKGEDGKYPDPKDMTEAQLKDVFG